MKASAANAVAARLAAIHIIDVMAAYAGRNRPLLFVFMMALP
jgi:hypothetical protein